MMLLSIDPGIRGVGAALWKEKKLVFAEYVKNTAATGGGPFECTTMGRAVWSWAGVRGFGARGDDVVLEWPQTYGGRSGKGSTDDLFLLAGVDTAIAVLFPEVGVLHYCPRQWKGQIGKPGKNEIYAIETRVLSRLDGDETASIRWPGAKKLTYDVTDAIGIGLHHLGRFERKRVFARE